MGGFRGRAVLLRDLDLDQLINLEPVCSINGRFFAEDNKSN